MVDILKIENYIKDVENQVRLKLSTYTFNVEIIEKYLNFKLRIEITYARTR